jgi:hypothetical protein
MSLVEFEPKIPAGEQPQTRALDRAATGIGVLMQYSYELSAIYIGRSTSMKHVLYQLDLVWKTVTNSQSHLLMKTPFYLERKRC